MNLLQNKVASVDNKDVCVFTLVNDSGMTVKITNIGATIMSIIAPDRDGVGGEVVLGFDDPMEYLSPDYLSHGFFFGATVGRFANRIAEGKFSIDNKVYQLEINNGPNHLHGGSGSFNTKVWSPAEIKGEDRVGVKMQYVSPNMENGYPGTLTVTVSFCLNNNNELTISYQAKTDKKTVLNLTNHSYFNLAGRGDVLGTVVSMHASKYTPKDVNNIPTGEISSVKDTMLDFIMPHKIGERIYQADDGYDHNLVIDGTEGLLRPAAEAYDERSGRTLEFLTTEPGFQFYTAYYLGGEFSRGDFQFNRFGAFCFEAQHYPDSPNKPGFPSPLLRPGETYTQTTIYKFGVK